MLSETDDKEILTKDCRVMNYWLTKDSNGVYADVICLCKRCIWMVRDGIIDQGLFPHNNGALHFMLV